MTQPRFIYRHANELRRCFAGWAISQHPYHKPPGLFVAIEDFVDFMFNKGRNRHEVLRITPKQLRERTVEFCHSCPTVRRWNEPRKGNAKFMFVSRYHTPKPEYDFIDLDALARNVARELIRLD